MTYNTGLIKDGILRSSERFKRLPYEIRKPFLDYKSSSIIGYAHGFLGKLGLKFEAAGKIRVFAMVDAWTQ